MEKPTEPNDRLLKILKIKRFPVENAYWSKIKRLPFWINIIYYLAFFSMIPLVAEMYSIFGLNIFDIIAMYTLLISSYFIYFYLSIHWYRNICNSPFEAKYFIFKDFELTIESDYHYLLNKCHEALRKMDFEVAEIDERIGTIEACESRPSGTFLTQVWITIVPIGNLMRAEKLSKKASKTSSQASKSLPRGTPRPFYTNSYKMKTTSFRIKIEFLPNEGLSTKSKITNRFVNLLLSKSKGVEEKEQSKKGLVEADTSSD